METHYTSTTTAELAVLGLVWHGCRHCACPQQMSAATYWQQCNASPTKQCITNQSIKHRLTKQALHVVASPVTKSGPCGQVLNARARTICQRKRVLREHKCICKPTRYNKKHDANNHNEHRMQPTIGMLYTVHASIRHPQSSIARKHHQSKHALHTTCRTCTDFPDCPFMADPLANYVSVVHTFALASNAATLFG